ncbi:MAG TPA: hypothetical protein VFR07_13280 [Mycobacteriales bacterium]|nr:hypothetical protein [Mycobacteriales bacterium]
MRARIAWGVVAVTLVCVVLDTWVTAAYRPLLAAQTWAEHGWPLAPLAALGCALMGALVVTRYPRHPVGWLLLLAGTSAISLAAEAYGLWVVEAGGPGPEVAAHVALWVSVLLGAPLALTAVTLVFLLSPDGHLLSRRWRWVALASVTGLLSYVGAWSLSSPLTFTLDQTAAGGAQRILAYGGILLIAGTLLASLVSLGLRLRSALGEVRRQLLWMATSATLLAGGFVFLLTQDGGQRWWVTMPLYVAYLAFPLCTAVAVLRHRLFEVDLIVNRALLVSLATGLVAGGYVLTVVGVGAALGGSTDSFELSLLATAVVALAFQPLRSRVVRLADRLAYGAAAAPYEALADLSRRLQASADPATLLVALADAAGTAVGARRATASLQVPGEADRVGTWPPGAHQARGPALQVPVEERGEQLGVLAVEMPPGRALRPKDERLLRDLAGQASVAFRNARLVDELAASVAGLATTAHDLALSRQRLVVAGDAERSGLERMITAEVLQHLEPLPGQLAALAAAPTVDPERLRTPIAAAGRALAALREITRGVFPAQLTRSGLGPALGSLLGRADAGRLEIEAAVRDRRLDPQAEAAAYFCVAEALRELGPPVEVTLGAAGEGLHLVVTGRGPLTLVGLRDRVDAAAGRAVVTPQGELSRLDVWLPDRQPPAAAQLAASTSGPKADLVT